MKKHNFSWTPCTIYKRLSFFYFVSTLNNFRLRKIHHFIWSVTALWKPSPVRLYVDYAFHHNFLQNQESHTSMSLPDIFDESFTDIQTRKSVYVRRRQFVIRASFYRLKKCFTLLWYRRAVLTLEYGTNTRRRCLIFICLGNTVFRCGASLWTRYSLTQSQYQLKLTIPTSIMKFWTILILVNIQRIKEYVYIEYILKCT